MVVTVYGICALTFMMIMYGLEARNRLYIAGFALGCLLSSVYGFLAGTWPFGFVEAVWYLVALRRYGIELHHAKITEEPSSGS
jgi:hypothetical protein